MTNIMFFQPLSSCKIYRRINSLIIFIDRYLKKVNTPECDSSLLIPELISVSIIFLKALKNDILGTAEIWIVDV